MKAHKIIAANEMTVVDAPKVVEVVDGLVMGGD